MTVFGLNKNQSNHFHILGKIKVNESQMVTPNIPATNGVIHAIDNIL